ncbi:MAG: hypothetical protein AAF467_27825 [Actinomycetota bacterium]
MTRYTSYSPCALAHRAGTRTRHTLTPTTNPLVEADLGPTLGAMWRPLDHGPPSARFVWRHGRHLAGRLRPSRDGWLTRLCRLVPWWSFIIIGPLALVRLWPNARRTLWTITTLTMVWPLAAAVTVAVVIVSWALRFIIGPPAIYVLAVAGFTGPGATATPAPTARRLGQLQRHLAREHRHPNARAERAPAVRPVTLAERQVIAAERIVALETQRHTQHATSGARRRRFNSEQLVGLAVIGATPIVLVLFLAIAGAIVALTEPNTPTNQPAPTAVQETTQ